MSKSELKAKSARYKSHVSSQQKAIVKLKAENKELKFINDGLRGNLEDSNTSFTALLNHYCESDINEQKIKVFIFFAGVFVSSLFIFIGQAVL